MEKIKRVDKWYLDFRDTFAFNIFEQLNISDENVSEFNTLESGKKLNEAKPLFMRIDKSL